MIGTQIKDPTSNNGATVTANGALLVQQEELMQSGGERNLLYSDFLRTSAGSEDMTINGSVTNQEFFISTPSVDKDLYISSITFTIADAGMTFGEFGNLSALTNGCRFFYTSDAGEREVAVLVTNYGVRELCGNGEILNNVFGTSEALNSELSIRLKFGFQYGLRLTGGTNQKLALTIRDNLSSLDLFTVKVFGFEREI